MKVILVQHSADKTSIFSFSVCLSVFIPEKDARLTENSYDTDKDLVTQKATDTSKTKWWSWLLIWTSQKKTVFVTFKVIFFACQQFKIKSKVQYMSSNCNESDEAGCFNQRKRWSFELDGVCITISITECVSDSLLKLEFADVVWHFCLHILICHVLCTCHLCCQEQNVGITISNNSRQFDSFCMVVTCKKHDATHMGLCSLWDIYLILCVLKIKSMTVKIKQWNSATWWNWMVTK